MSKYLPEGTEVIVSYGGKTYEGKITRVDGNTGCGLPYQISFNGVFMWYGDCGHAVGTSGSTFKVKEEKKVTNFKEGDMVKLKEKFYDEPDFKEMPRVYRKHIAQCSKIFFPYRAAYCQVPASLLELAELSKPKITGVWFDECTEYPPKKPAMRKWTEAEITEAKAITCDLFFSIVGKNFGYKFLDYYCRIHMNGKEFTAKACNTDEPNINIGRMVALCKATGTPFPDWIRKESK